MHRRMTFLALVASIGMLTLGETAAGQPPADTKPIIFELRVPADAVVTIEGAKTQSTGEVRQYQTPAVAAGKKYGYTVKITSQGKTVTKEIALQHGGTNAIDLRSEFEAKAEADAASEDKKTDTKSEEKKPAETKEKKKPDTKTEEKENKDKKTEDKKPVDKKDEGKPEEKKTETKPEEKKSDKKPEENKEAKPEDKKTDEKKTDEKKTDEKKSEEKKQDKK